MAEEVGERMVLKREGIMLESESKNQFVARGGQLAVSGWLTNL